MNKLIPLALFSLALAACGSGGSNPAQAVSKPVVEEDASHEQEAIGMSDEVYMERIVERATEAVEASFFLIKDGYNSQTEHREPVLVRNGTADSVEAVELYVGFYTKLIGDYTPIFSKRIVEWYEDGVVGAKNAMQQQPLNFDGDYYLEQMKMVLDAGEVDLLEHYYAHIETRFNNVDEQYAALQEADLPSQIAEMLDTVWVEVNTQIADLQLTD